MALPSQVQAQLDQADALLTSINAPPEASLDQTAEPGNVDAGVAPVAQVAVAVEPPPKPVDEWEHRYKSLDGIVRGRDTKIAQLSADLEQTRLELQRLSAEKSSKPESSASSPEDVEMFGADLVEMVRRVNRQSLGSVAETIDSRLKTLEQRVEGTAEAVATSASEKFIATLEASVPNWDSINQSDGFKQWLGEEDPVYGVPRQRALKHAEDTLNAARTIRIFQTFQGSLAPAVIAPKVNSLDRQVAPRAVASVAPTGQDLRIITTAEVDSFYRDVAQGRYRGNEAEQQRREIEINAALSEQRIR